MFRHCYIFCNPFAQLIVSTAICKDCVVVWTIYRQYVSVVWWPSCVYIPALFPYLLHVYLYMHIIFTQNFYPNL